MRSHLKDIYKDGVVPKVSVVEYTFVVSGLHLRSQSSLSGKE